MKTMATGIAFALVLWPAFAQAKESQAKMTDARLVTLLQKCNREEIEAGQMAQRRGMSEAVRNLGKTLIADHTQAEKEVAKAAKKAKVAASDSALTDQDRQEEKVGKNKMEQMKKMDGAEFDKAFASEMSNDHAHMISLLKEGKGDLHSDALKKLVDDTLPVLQQHKDLADAAASKVARAGSQGNQGRSPR